MDFFEGAGHRIRVVAVALQKTETEIVGRVLLSLRELRSGQLLGQRSPLRTAQRTDHAARSAQRIPGRRSQVGLAHRAQRVAVADMSHFVADDRHQFVVVHQIHQSGKNADTAVGRCEGVDLRGFVDAEIQRNAVDGYVARRQPIEAFGVGIVYRQQRILRVGVVDVFAGHLHHVLVFQRGGLQHVDRRLQRGVRQPDPRAGHDDDVDDQNDDRDFQQHTFSVEFRNPV